MRTIKVNEQLDTPAAPVAGEVTQPTCTTATGSFQIADFDADSDYDFTPSVVSISDSGLVTANAGDYSFTVTNEAGCISPASENIKVNEQLDTPAAPVAGEVTQPTCTTATGSFQIADFDADSDYDFTPGVVSISDSGLVTANAGNYSFTVTNAAGCISPASENIKVNEQLNTPAAPVVDSSINTTCNLNNGSIVLVAVDDVEFSIDGVNYQTSTLFSDLATGTYSITTRFIDGECISSSTEVEIIAIPDTEDPILSEMSDINVNTDAGVCGAVITFSAPSATDNCEGTVITLNEGSMASGSEFPVGTATVTYTATDAAGNASTVSFDVIVVDNEAPAIACPANVNQTAEAGESFAIVTFEDATATDNCDVSVEQTAGLTSGSQFPIGVSTVEFTATDASGNTSTCNFTITITDNDPPTILCPANIDMDVDAGICGAVVSFETPTATDNSGQEVTVTQTAGPASGEVFPVGTTTVTFTATDAAGNTASCSFDVTVNDNEDPTFGSVSDITVNTDAGICGAVVNYEVPTATDNCEGTEVSLTEGLASGSEFPVGTTTVTYTATDAAGNTSTVSFDVIVVDNEDPAITCPANVNQTTEAGESFAIVTFEDATATDNCDVIVEQTAGLTSGSQFPIGESTVTFTATDASGNTSSCSFTITITDNDPPTIVCPANIDMDVDAGICGAVVSFETPTATDNSGLEVTVTQTAGPASGEVFPVGTTTVTFTATDAAGNTASCSFDVTVNDTEDPTFESVSDITVNTDAGVCGAVVSFEAPTATDNCEGTVVTLNEGSLASGSEFPVGTTTVTYTATDAVGNTVSTSFTVTIIDNEAPVIVCIDNISQATDMGEATAVVTFEAPLGTDNCGATTEQTAGLPSGSEFPIGTTTNTYIVTDAAGNTATCSFTVTIIDEEDPTISCPANINMNVDAGLCGAVVEFEMPVANDNSGNVSVTQTAGPASGEVFPVGTTTVTFTATDAAGNTASCSFDVTVNDTEDPTFESVSDINVNTDAGVCGAVITFSAPSATDNCEGTVITLNEGSMASGSEFPVGTTTVTYTATDAAGNTSTVSFDVIVVDNEDPAITCPANVNQTTEAGESFAIVTFEDATATDNCDVIVEQTAGLTSGSQFPIGESNVEFTATDASGNTSSCSFTITITDNDPPTILCPANIDMEVDAGICGAVVSFETPTASDNSGQEVTVTQTAGPASGEEFPVGTTTVTFTATDAAGNTASCSFDVSVNDTEDPTFGSVSDITVNTDAGVCGAVVSFEAPTATDNCEGTVVTLNEGSLASGSEFPVGTTTVTYTATDAAGNTSTVSFDVIVVDNEDPAITCPANVNQTTEAGESFAIVTFEDATATDNCDVTVEQTAGLTSGSQFPIGESTVTFTATDASGNTSSCSFTITITDNDPPTILCPANIDMEVDAGICGAVVSFETPTATDNSGQEVTVTQTAGPASGEVFPVGTTTVTFTATDAAGNTASCSFDVTVNDTEDPTFGSVSDITVNTDAGVCGAVVTFSAPSATDNCEGTVVTLNEGSLASGSEFPVGTTTVTYTATDAVGNTVSTSFTVTIIDNEAPVINCAENISLTVDFGVTSLVVNYESVTATDNCPDTTIEQTAGLSSGSSFPIGTTTNTFVVTDASGNTATCSFDIIVEELLDEKPEPPLVVEVIQPTCEVATGTITVQTIEGLTYSINGTDYQESGVFINLEPGTYSITAQNSSGQISDAVQVTLDEPTATTIQTTTVDLCIEDSVYDLFELLSGDFDETGTWVDTDQTGALAGSFIDPKLLAVGNYNFTYVLGGNCPSTTSVLVSINDLCVVDPEGCDIDGIKAGVSKAVTPNGDGFNDFFEIKVDPLCGFRFGVQIFNRWGAEIYSNPNYTNEWDGFSNKSFTGSNQLPSGTYFYILTVNNGEIAPIQGYIYLGTK
ncbi:HYR domain-containing protein [Gillisia limnaea]|uniref:HYR domain-containing protein n=1 Tax=Gillisia limnaea TaxID=195907 RepID=UPI0002FCF619|nr:HYR domain-containing protein [Gillisia limnaea]